MYRIIQVWEDYGRVWRMECIAGREISSPKSNDAARGKV